MFNLLIMIILPMILILLNTLTIFIHDIMIIWFFMETTNFMFICFLSPSTKNKKMIFLYFIIQIVASLLMLTSIIPNFLLEFSSWLLMILIIALSIKLSIPPFHPWLPVVANNMTLFPMFILLTFQKIPPFYILSLVKLPLGLLYSMIILCSIVPPFLMLNLTNFKSLLAFSSINQTSWMLLLLKLKKILWLQYFYFYSMILGLLLIIIHMSKVNFSLTPPLRKNLYLIFPLFMLNLASLPPFSFFLIKWYSILLIIMNSHAFFLLMLMMVSSFVMLYIYLNMMLSMMFYYSYKSKLLNLNLKMTHSFNFLFLMSMTSSSIILII